MANLSISTSCGETHLCHIHVGHALVPPHLRALGLHTSVSRPHPDLTLSSGQKWSRAVSSRGPQVTFPHTCSVLTSNHTFCYSVLEPQQAWLAPPSSHVRLQVLDLQCEKGTCSGFTFVNEVPNLLWYLGYLIPENSHLKMMSWRPQHWPLLSLHLILEIENKARGETCLRTALSEGSQSYCKSFQGQTCKMGTSYPATIWGRRQGLVSGAGRVMRTNLQGTRKSPFPTSICHNL